jgi:alkylglycerol monooxygenase
MPEKVLGTALISIVVVNCGVLFEQRQWVKWLEWVRIFVYPALLAALTYYNGWSMWNYAVAIVYFAISFTWFYSLQKHAQIQMV